LGVPEEVVVVVVVVEPPGLPDVALC